MMNRLIPKVFYADMEDGLNLFVNCLKFKLLHQDATLAVIERDGAKAYLVEDTEFAAKDRPELTIETDTIDDLYAEISAGHANMLHPNAKTVERKPWGSREFAVRDKTDVCVIFRQW
ncbi:MAG: hypothetical protein ABIZ09_15735 [Rhodoferax sp.]